MIIITNKKIGKTISILTLLISFVFFTLILSGFFLAANPTGPDNLNISANRTKSTVNTKSLNISGGYIGTINITANVQNIRWKAFVGRVVGTFVLEDSSNSKIYDWRITSLSGRIYATRNDSTISWSNINCSNITTLNQENVLMDHANPDDNLTKTFNITAGATHHSFNVGTKSISANSCPTLNTYVNNATQDNYFEETALYDGGNLVFATILDPGQTGFDGGVYDFQMIVPENGASSFQSSTAYYLYIELGN